MNAEKTTNDGAAAANPVAGGAESPETQFFTAYGGTMVASCHVQYRLADVYAASFDDPRSGSTPRVQEKWHEAYKSTLGQAEKVARDWLPPDLRTDVEIAVDWRNYLAHKFVFDTRAMQGTPEGLSALAERLMVVFHFFVDVNNRLHEQHRQVFLKWGVPPEVYDSYQVPFDQLEMHDQVRVPKKRERIVAIYDAVDEDGLPRLYFENIDGEFWLINDVGLAAVQVSADLRARMVLSPKFQGHVPADVTSRPSRTTTPPAWRSAFDYDLDFSTGATLKIERAPGGDHITWEVVERTPRARP